MAGEVFLTLTDYPTRNVIGTCFKIDRAKCLLLRQLYPHVVQCVSNVAPETDVSSSNEFLKTVKSKSGASQPIVTSSRENRRSAADETHPIRLAFPGANGKSSTSGVPLEKSSSFVKQSERAGCNSRPQYPSSSSSTATKDSTNESNDDGFAPWDTMLIPLCFQVCV